MRTTLDLDDELLRAARKRAAAQGISLTRYLEQALAAALTPPSGASKPFRLRWKPHSGRYLGEVDLANRDALIEFMEGRS